MAIIEKFKENKKVMQIKMDQAHKLIDEAADEFVESIKPLVKDASEEDIKAFLNAEDNAIDFEDKLAVIAAYADSHGRDAGFIVIGL